MTLSGKNMTRRGGPNVVDLSRYRSAPRVSAATMRHEFSMDAGYNMPERLAAPGSSQMSDAQNDARDVTKRAMHSFSRRLAQPENIPLFLNALDGRKALTRPSDVHAKMMQLTHMLHPDSAGTHNLPQVAIAKSVTPELFSQVASAHVLPTPVAMAYVDVSPDKSSVVFAHELGFRDMQLHAQSVPPMHVLKMARGLDLELNEETAITRLRAIQTPDADMPAVFPMSQVKIRHEGQESVVPASRLTIDPKLSK